MTTPTDFLDEDVRKQVAKELGRYVYMLVDPRDGIPFYVSKGQDLHLDAHEREIDFDDEGQHKNDQNTQNDKTEKIREIKDVGDKVEKWIVRHNMTKPEYTAVEVALIDLLTSMPIARTTKDTRRQPLHVAKGQLTNQRREKAAGHGIQRLDDFIIKRAAPPLTTTEPLLIIKLGEWKNANEPEDMPGGWQRHGYGYKKEWLGEARHQHMEEIAKSACGWWNISPQSVKREKIKYAVAVYLGVTRALLKIDPDSWVEHQDYGNKSYRRAFEYTLITEGDDYDDIVGEYGYRLGKGWDSQNRHYWRGPEK